MLGWWNLSGWIYGDEINANNLKKERKNWKVWKRIGTTIGQNIFFVERYMATSPLIILIYTEFLDRLCGLVVRVPGYRSRGPGLDSQLYQIFWEAVRLKRGPLSLVRITEELLERKVAAPVQNTEINNRGDSLPWPRCTLYPLKLALTSLTSDDRSVGIVRWRTKAPEFSFYTEILNVQYNGKMKFYRR
jgi:hypothetical protein